MDFLALPRRDLQALCKRNDIHANMTSAAMADALRALPKVEGIEEYVKVLQPVALPQTEVKSVNEEQKPKKQERPLPRGRRATAKSSEPTEPEEDKEKLEEDAKRQSNKEDAQAPGVGRRGASRRARPVPTVPLPPGKAVAEEDRQEDNLKREAKRDNAPAPVVGRRGASWRAQPSPAVAAPATESEVAGAEVEQMEEKVEDHKQEAIMDDVPALGVGRRGASRRARPAPSVAALAGKVVAEEEQRGPIPRGRHVKAKGRSTEPIRLDDSDDEEKEDAKPEEQEQEDAQILGVGRRGGASRRAQAAPAVAAPEAKVEEEQRAPVPRGRRVKAKSTELDSKEHRKPEEERGDAPAIGVGRRGASRHAPAPSEAPATRRSAAARKDEVGDVVVEDVPIRATRQRKPTMKAAAAAAVAEEKPPRRATRRGAVMSTLLPQEVQEKPQEAVGAPDVAVESAVPIRATRQRKPTMKAVAAAATAEEKAPPRATRRGAVMRTLLPQEVLEEPQGVFCVGEAVGAPVSYQRCDALEEFGEASDHQKEELNEVDTAKQDEDQDLVIIEDEKLMEETPAEEPSVTDQAQEEPQGVFSDAEAVGALVSYQRCDALEELAEASDPQKEELNVVDVPKQDEDQDVVIIEDEKLMEETPAEEPSVTDQECTDNSEMQEQQVDDEKCHAPLATQEDEDQDVVIIKDEKLMQETPAEEPSVTDQECTDNLEMQEQQVDDKKCHAPLATQENEDQDVVIMEDEKLMDETPAEEPSVTDEECTDNSEMHVQQVDDEKCHAPLLTQAESPILGLVSTVTEQASEDDEGASFQDDGGSSSGLLDKGVCEEIYDAGEEMELVLGVQTLQAPLIGSESGASYANHESEVGNFNEVPTVREEISEVDTLEVSKEKEHTDIAELQTDIVDEAAFLDCSSNISLVAEEEINEKVNTAGEETNDELNSDKVLHDSVDNTILLDCSSDISWVEMEKAGNVRSEMPENPAALDEDGDKPNEVVIGDNMSQITVTDEVVQEEKGVLITDEMKQGTAGMHDDIKDDQFETVTMDEDVVKDNFETDSVHADEQMEAVTIDKVLELTGTKVEDVEEKTPPVVYERQKSTVTMDKDVVNDHFKTDVVHADELMEVATTDEVPELSEIDDEVVEEMKTPLLVDEKQLSIATMNEDIVDDHFKTHVAHADEQKEVVATEVPKVTGTDSEIEEKAPLIVDEKKQSSVTMDGDVVFDHFKTDIAHADEHKEVIGIVTEVPDEVTGTDDEVVEEKAVVITEDIPNQGTVPNITHTMDECLKENHFGTDFGHDNEQKKAITADFEPQVSRTQDGGARKENALRDDVTESLSKSIITMEPSVFKNSSEKKPAEPMTVLEEKGVKEASESEDLTKLSLGQLRAKLKEKLNAKKNKEANKRVALARVDENVCRSHAKGQQQNLNLQQH